MEIFPLPLPLFLFSSQNYTYIHTHTHTCIYLLGRLKIVQPPRVVDIDRLACPGDGTTPFLDNFIFKAGGGSLEIATVGTGGTTTGGKEREPPQEGSDLEVLVAGDDFHGGGVAFDEGGGLWLWVGVGVRSEKKWIFFGKILFCL